MKTILDITDKLDIDEDIEQLPQINIIEPEVKFNDDLEIDITDDYQFARRKLMLVMSASEAVMVHSVKEMANDPGPRQTEAFSSLIKVINETTDRIFSLHEKMQKIKPKKEIESTTEDGKKTVKVTVNDIIDSLGD